MHPQAQSFAHVEQFDFTYLSHHMVRWLSMLIIITSQSINGVQGKWMDSLPWIMILPTRIDTFCIADANHHGAFVEVES